MFNNSLSINKTYFLKYHDQGILENIARSAFYKGMTIVGQLLLIPLSVKILSKETFGIWITISTIINWLTFFDIGFNNGLRHKLVESIASGDTVLSKKYIATSYFYITAICLVIGCVYLVLSLSFDFQTLLFSKTERSQQVIVSLGLAFGLFLIRFVLMTINYINLATQNSSKNDLIQFIVISLTLATLYIFKAARTLDLIDVVLIFSIIPIVVYVAYSIYFFYKNSNFRLSIAKIDLKLGKSLMSIGTSFFFVQLVSMLLFTFPVFLINKYYGSSLVTEYNVSNKLYNVVYMGLTIVLTPFWTAFTKAHFEGRVEWLKTNLKKVQIIGIGFIIFLVVMYIMSPWMYLLWLGKNVGISNSMNLSSALYNLSLLLLAPLNYYLNGRGKLRIQVYLSMVNLLLFFPLCYLFAKTLTLGAPGIIYGSVSLLTINYFTTLFLLNKKYI